MKKIEPNEYYTARQVSQMGILPWKSPYTFNLKLNSKRGQAVFKPLIEQHKHNKTYKIKGENIIRFISDLERGIVII
jgi:predicted transcriptional regulator